MHSKSRCRSFSLLVAFFVHVLVVEAMSRAPYRRSNLVPSFHSSSVKLSQMKDSRPEGISHERSNVLLLQHLLKTSPNKTLAHFSKPGLQQVYLDYSDSLSTEKSETFLKYLTTTSKSRDSVWEVEIMEGWYPYGNWTFLSDFIEALPSISTLKWSASFPIPAIILKSIEHSTCHLYYKLSSYTLNTDPEEFESEIDDLGNERADILARVKTASESEIESLINSNVLYSVSADLDGHASHIDLVYRILTTCPNVRELNLNIGQRNLGYRGDGYRGYGDELYAFNFSNTSQALPPLEVLTLRQYGLESATNGQMLMAWETPPDLLRWPWNKFPISIVQLVGYPWIRSVGGLVKGSLKWRPIRWDETTEETNLDSWMRLMDWTHLHTLNLQQPSSQLRKLEGSFLPNLKHVTISGIRCSMQPTLHFLSNISALNSLAILDVGHFSPDPVISVITAHHCPGLQNLRLDRTFLNSTHLSQLLHKCPKLYNLEISMDRVEEWDYEILDILTGFPELRSLTMRFDIRRIDRDEDHYDQYLGYSWEGIYEENRSGLVEQDDEAVLLALKGYLAKKKVGKRFETIRTLIGSLEVPKVAV